MKQLIGHLAEYPVQRRRNGERLPVGAACSRTGMTYPVASLETDGVGHACAALAQPCSAYVIHQTCGNAVRVGALLLSTLLVFAFAPSAFAQGEPETTETAADITRDEVNAVARELWCPLCSGVRLDSCELAACDQMREEIAIALAEGEDVETIRASFVESYGPQVLGAPPRSGFNWLAWILPFVVLAAGGAILGWRSREIGRRTQEAPSEQPANEPRDVYARRLETELRELDG